MCNHNAHTYQNIKITRISRAHASSREIHREGAAQFYEKSPTHAEGAIFIRDPVLKKKKREHILADKHHNMNDKLGPSYDHGV